MSAPFNHTRSRTRASGQRDYRLAMNAPLLPAGFIPLGTVGGRIHGAPTDYLLYCQLEKRIKDEMPQFCAPNRRIRLLTMPDPPRLAAYVKRYPRTRTSPRKPDPIPPPTCMPCTEPKSRAPKSFGTRADPPILAKRTRSAAAKININDDDEPPELINASSDEEDDVPDLVDSDGVVNNAPRYPYRSQHAIVLSSDESSDIDHDEIRNMTESDHDDSDVERTTPNLMVRASEKARRGYAEAMKTYTDESTLNLLVNNSNQTRSDQIFDTTIYPVVSHEIRLALQPFRATLNVRSAMNLIAHRIVITNRLPYLAHLRSMLNSTRILPGDTFDMLVGRLELINAAIEKLSGNTPVTKEDFVLLLMSITELSSPDFTVTNNKIRAAADDSITKARAIHLFTARLQDMIGPYAEPPVYFHCHPSTFTTSHGHLPLRGERPIVPIPRPFGPSQIPFSFANRTPPRPFANLNNTPRVHFGTPQHVAAITATPANRMRPFTTPSAPRPNSNRHVPISTGNTNYANRLPSNSASRTAYRCSTFLDGCGGMHDYFKRCPTTEFIHQSLAQHPHHAAWMQTHGPPPPADRPSNGHGSQRKV